MAEGDEQCKIEASFFSPAPNAGLGVWKWLLWDVGRCMRSVSGGNEMSTHGMGVMHDLYERPCTIIMYL